MAYNKKAQKKYSEKIKVYTVKYSLADVGTTDAIEKYCADNAITHNALFKEAIREKLGKANYL